MPCLCTPASFTIIIYLFVNISQPGNDLREVAPGHRLLPHAPLGLHKVEERAAGEVYGSRNRLRLSPQTAHPGGVVQVILDSVQFSSAANLLQWHALHQQTGGFSSCSEIGLRNLSMFEWENFFTDYILFLGQFCDESNESRYKKRKSLDSKRTSYRIITITIVI